GPVGGPLPPADVRTGSGLLHWRGELLAAPVRATIVALAQARVPSLPGDAGVAFLAPLSRYQVADIPARAGSVLLAVGRLPVRVAVAMTTSASCRLPLPGRHSDRRQHPGPSSVALTDPREFHS